MADVTAYVQTFSERFGEAAGEVPEVVAIPERTSAPTPESLDRGRAHFALDELLDLPPT